MSEHRRKPPQPQGGGRAAARRGQSGASSGRRAAPRGTTGSPSDAHGTGSHGSESESPTRGRRADARRAAQRGRTGRAGSAPPSRGRGRAAPQGKKRFIDYPRHGKYGWRRWMPSWKLVSGLFIAFFGSLVAVAGIGYAMVGIPSEEQAEALAENNVYYWADGTQMVATGGGGQNRQNVSLDRIPKAMQHAVISAENKSFYEDSGIDPMGIGRAVFNMATGGNTQGGSTITQQFVKNTYLTQDQTLSRKFKEMFISIKVGAKLDKNKILQGYLNTNYYGRGAYGIQAAAQTYYGKDSVDLTPSECAFLAALLKGPTYYDPAGNVNVDKAATSEENLRRSKKRWAWILKEMREDGYLSGAEYKKAVAKYPMPQGRKAIKGMTGQVSYLVQTAKQYVLKKSDITEAQFDQGGYQVYTTFEKGKVEALAKAVEKIEKENLDPEKREKDKYVQFGAAAVKPNDGAIVAIYGGAGFENGHFNNNADTLGVPVGSTWKPFVMAAAMQYGTYKTDGVGVSPESKYNGDDHLKIQNPDGTFVLKKDNTPFYQENESEYPWGFITLNKAMERSVNTPFVQLGMDVGMSKVADVAERAGLLRESFAGLNASFALGTSTPSAIRMADAYATFAASGKQADPYSVTAVKQRGTELPGFDKPKVEQAMPENVANNVTAMLENVVKNGTGTKALELGRPAAGKTGTTDENKSAWFVGYTPQLSTAVGMFREDPKSHQLLSMYDTAGEDSIHGGDIPAELWTTFMKAALKGEPHTEFPAAKKIGEIADGVGAPTTSAPPTSTSTESTPPASSPAISETPTTPTSTTTQSDESCPPFSFQCGGKDDDEDEEETGGAGPGGTDTGGTDGGVSGSPDPSDSEEPGRGGGFLRGPNG